MSNLREELLAIERYNLTPDTTFFTLAEENNDLYLKVDTLQRENKRLREVLENIAHPLVYLQNEAESQGALLDGQMALFLINDADYLKNIARTALKDNIDL